MLMSVFAGISLLASHRWQCRNMDAVCCTGFSRAQLPCLMPSCHFICMAQPPTDDTNTVADTIGTDMQTEQATPAPDAPTSLPPATDHQPTTTDVTSTAADTATAAAVVTPPWPRPPNKWQLRCSKSSWVESRCNRRKEGTLSGPLSQTSPERE